MSFQTQEQTGGGRLQGGQELLPGGGATAACWGEDTPPPFRLQLLTSDPAFLSQSLSYRLKTSHSYFTQVQCQLAVTRLQRADFVVFTLEETVIVPVTFDPELWKDTLSKLERFYEEARPHLDKPADAAAARREL